MEAKNTSLNQISKTRKGSKEILKNATFIAIFFILPLFFFNFLSGEIEIDPAIHDDSCFVDEIVGPYSSSDPDLNMYNKSISEFSELYEGVNYDFNADLIDSNNFSRDYQSGFLQTMELGFNNIYNDSTIYSVNNRYLFIPNNYEMWNGTMWFL